MGFYEELSRYYDEVFPVDASDMAFPVERTQGCDRILDLGCGTGNKTVFFASGGVEVVGIDSDSGMILRANKENKKDTVTYEVLDMMKIDERFSPSSFNGAVCLGNSMAHMLGTEQLSAFISKVSAVLEPNGRFIVQVLNYDRILDNGLTTLPILETPNVIFRREYKWRNSEMRFHTTLQIKKSGELYENDIPLFPLRHDDLDKGLKEAGFASIHYYGSFTGEEYSQSSFILMAEGTKS